MLKSRDICSGTPSKSPTNVLGRFLPNWVRWSAGSSVHPNATPAPRHRRRTNRLAAMTGVTLLCIFCDQAAGLAALVGSQTPMQAHTALTTTRSPSEASRSVLASRRLLALMPRKRIHSLGGPVEGLKGLPGSYPDAKSLRRFILRILKRPTINGKRTQRRKRSTARKTARPTTPCMLMAMKPQRRLEAIGHILAAIHGQSSRSWSRNCVRRALRQILRTTKDPGLRNRASILWLAFGKNLSTAAEARRVPSLKRLYRTVPASPRCRTNMNQWNDRTHFSIGGFTTVI